MKAPEPVLNDDAIYLGDNGMSFCGKCAGQSARYTGRDLSGQEVMRVQPEDVTYAAQMGMTIRCEGCGRCAS